MHAVGTTALFRYVGVTPASPLGRALSNGRVGDEISLRLPHVSRRLRITELVTVHQEAAS